MRELDRLHQKLEAAGAWQAHTRVETVIDRLGLDPDLPFASSSGGRKRQTLLARAIVREPGVLLLDEPGWSSRTPTGSSSTSQRTTSM